MIRWLKKKLADRACRKGHHDWNLIFGSHDLSDGSNAYRCDHCGLKKRSLWILYPWGYS